MPIIRKVIDFGKTSKGVILPKSWLKYYEIKKGKPIETVAIEVNEALIIKPFSEKPSEH
jgi:bifunctional DNA-binding transcriptional regulator/antitoxin component of YhaV-PrlF toxin-antitoxin module